MLRYKYQSRHCKYRSRFDNYRTRRDEFRICRRIYRIQRRCGDVFDVREPARTLGRELGLDWSGLTSGKLPLRQTPCDRAPLPKI